MRGNLGMRSDLEGRKQRLSFLGQWKLLQIKLRSLAKIADGLGNRFALSRGPGFGVESYKTALFGGNQYSTERHVLNLHHLIPACKPVPNHVHKPRRWRLSRLQKTSGVARGWHNMGLWPIIPP